MELLPCQTFPLLNIFKYQAKLLARDEGLKLAKAQEALACKAGFADYHVLSVVVQRHPIDARLMLAVFEVTDFGDAIYEDDVYAHLGQELEDQLPDAIADINDITGKLT